MIETDRVKELLRQGRTGRDALALYVMMATSRKKYFTPKDLFDLTGMDKSELPIACQILKDLGYAQAQGTVKNRMFFLTSVDTKNWKNNADFMAYYSIYPKKAVPQRAFQHWLRLSAEERSELLDRVTLLNERNLWSDDKYIPYAATFITERRWEEEIKTTTKQAENDDYGKSCI